MEKEQQTEALFKELYELTKMFTRALQPRYYYQYNGDIEDLASDFFLQFMLPKARKGRPKESLLDKFNPATTSLAYLVKVCVTRKLIDQSRQNPQRYVSIDAMVEENGDYIKRAFKLVAEENETALTDSRFLHKVIEGYHNLPDAQKNKHFVEIFGSQSTLASILQPAIMYVHGCPIQQVTDKTVVLYVPSLKSMVNFSLETGLPRGKYNPFALTSNELAGLRQYVPYHSQFSRDLFLEFFQEGVSYKGL